MCQGLNSHYFYIIGDKLINPIPYGFIGPHYKDSLLKGGVTIPNIATFDYGTYENTKGKNVKRFFPMKCSCIFEFFLSMFFKNSLWREIQEERRERGCFVGIFEKSFHVSAPNPKKNMFGGCFNRKTRGGSQISEPHVSLFAKRSVNGTHFGGWSKTANVWWF